MNNCFSRLLLSLLVLLGLCGSSVAAASPTSQSLAEVLNSDGTLKAGAAGSFDARQFRMGTAPDGRPVFRPAGTLGPGDERWQSGFGLPGNGMDDNVAVIAVASNGDVYAGGRFTQAGGIMANSVAKWNGTVWSSLGTGSANGVDGWVNALAVASNGDVYAGGGFRTAGGITANYVAKWDGAVWSSLGMGTANGVYYSTGSRPAGNVRSFAFASNGDLYVGGDFRFAGAGLPKTWLNGTVQLGVAWARVLLTA